MSVRKAVFCSHREILLFLSPCFLWCTTGLCFGSYSVFIALAADFQEVCWWHPNLFPGYFDVSVEVCTRYQRRVLKKNDCGAPLDDFTDALVPRVSYCSLIVRSLRLFSECPLCILVMNAPLSIRRHDSRFTLDKDFFFFCFNLWLRQRALRLRSQMMRERQRTQLKGGGDQALADSEMMAAALPALSTSGPTSAHLWISSKFILSLHQLRVCAAAFWNQSQISSVSSLLSLLLHNLQHQQKELQRSETHTHTHIAA